MVFSRLSTGRGKNAQRSSVCKTHDLPLRAPEKDIDMLDAGSGATSDTDKADDSLTVTTQPPSISADTLTCGLPEKPKPLSQPLAFTPQDHPRDKANPPDARVRCGEDGEAPQSILAALARRLASEKKLEIQLHEYKRRLVQMKTEMDEQKKSYEGILERRLAEQKQIYEINLDRRLEEQEERYEGALKRIVEEQNGEWEHYLEEKLHEKEVRHHADKARIEEEMVRIEKRYEEDISRIESARRTVERQSKEHLSSLEKEKRKVREHAMIIRTLQEHALKNVESAQWTSESDTEIVRQLDRILEDVNKWSKKWSRSAATGEGQDLGLNQCLDLLPEGSLAIRGLLRERMSFERKIPMWLIISAAVSKVAFDSIIGDAFFAFQGSDAKSATSIYSKDIGRALNDTLRSLHSRESIDVLLLQSRPSPTDIR